MSTKTIAVDTRVYERLAASRKDGESFSRAIDRLLADAEAAHTGGDILRRLEHVTALSPANADAFLAIVADNRSDERWDPHDLR